MQLEAKQIVHLTIIGDAIFNFHYKWKRRNDGYVSNITDVLY